VWGFHKGVDIETLHLFFLKRVLKVRKSTSNYMVYFELEKKTRYCRMLKYWIKILKTENCCEDMFESSVFKSNDKLNWGCKIRGKFFCFNINVSNLYNNSVVAKIYGMAYIFTLLMFRKPNKTTINKNKTTNFCRSTSFQFSFIFRYFKVFQVKKIVYI
jgi:hypothetical protein